MSDTAPPRIRVPSDYECFVPVHVVWEITLACNLKCMHCGSRAGRPRPNELTTAECIAVVESLARLGTREISLIGGEAYLRKDWTEIIRAIRSHDIYCAIQSGGRALTDQRLDEAIDAGLQGVGISIDGLAPLHDRLRGVPGSFEMALEALRRARCRGLNISVNTQIGSATMEHLPALMGLIIAEGAKQWQIQLTVAMGNAVDNPELLLQPYQLRDLMPLLARLYREGVAQGLLMTVGNNIGYFGPYEHLWRGFGDDRIHWTGCSAGQTLIGLEADGTVKGCPSLATVGYAGGNVRDMTLENIWRTSEAIHFGRLRSVDDLWGFCRTCYYADVCRSGCTWTGQSLLGRAGNNPYCHYRVLELEKRGVRERVVKRSDAPDEPFATGLFDLVVEASPDAGRAAERSVPREKAVGTARGQPEPGGITPEPRRWQTHTPSIKRGQSPPRLALCRACNAYIWPDEQVCPHCGASVAEAAAEHDRDVQRCRDLIEAVKFEIEAAKAQAGGTIKTA